MSRELLKGLSVVYELSRLKLGFQVHRAVWIVRTVIGVQFCPLVFLSKLVMVVTVAAFEWVGAGASVVVSTMFASTCWFVINLEAAVGAFVSKAETVSALQCWVLLSERDVAPTNE